MNVLEAQQRGLTDRFANHSDPVNLDQQAGLAIYQASQAPKPEMSPSGFEFVIDHDPRLWTRLIVREGDDTIRIRQYVGGELVWMTFPLETIEHIAKLLPKIRKLQKAKK